MVSLFLSHLSRVFGKFTSAISCHRDPTGFRSSRKFGFTVSSYKMAASLVTASNINGEFEFSEYCKSLDELRMARYKEKVSICGFDPYQLKMTDYSNDLSLLPGIEYPDIVNYLALECSFLTMKEMKTFKSTEAYNMFILELVGTVYTKKIAGVDKVAVFAMVSSLCDLCSLCDKDQLHEIMNMIYSVFFSYSNVSILECVISIPSIIGESN